MPRKRERLLGLGETYSIGWQHEGSQWVMHAELVDVKEPDRPTYVEGYPAEMVAFAEAILRAAEAIKRVDPNINRTEQIQWPKAEEEGEDERE